MNIYLTGRNGFIGSHLAKALYLQGHNLVESYNTPDLVIHLSAVTHIRQEFDPMLFETNIVKTNRIFTYFPDTRIIYASSTSAQELNNPYAYTKRYAEWLGEKHGNALGFRFFNVYGPNNNKGIVRKALQCAQSGETMTLAGGSQVRDFIHVDDVVRDIIEHLEKETGVIDCGTANGTRIRDLVKTVEKVTGRHIPIQEIEAGEGEQAFSISSRAVPGAVNLEEGLLKTIKAQ